MAKFAVLIAYSKKRKAFLLCKSAYACARTRKKTNLQPLRIAQKKEAKHRQLNFSTRICVLKHLKTAHFRRTHRMRFHHLRSPFICVLGQINSAAYNARRTCYLWHMCRLIILYGTYVLECNRQNATFCAAVPSRKNGVCVI